MYYWLDKMEGVIYSYPVQYNPWTEGLTYLGSHEEGWYPTEEELNDHLK